MNMPRFLSRLWREPEEVREIDARVVAVLAGFGQAKIKDDFGYQYSITEKTDGVDLEQLKEGQRVHCVVTSKYPRVLRARLIG